MQYKSPLFIAIIFMVFLFFGQSFAQSNDVQTNEYGYLEAEPSHKNERAFSFSLSTNGLALGGLYRFKLPNYTHLGINLEFFAIRDDNEIAIVDPFTGRPFKLNDANRMFMIPVNLELKKRLFTHSIEDDFRPHLMFQAGGAYGMNFPKEVLIDTNSDGVLERVQPDNQFQLTYNLLAGFGVDIKTRGNFFATIRPQYRYTFFPETIAGKKDHSTFEIKIEIGTQL